MFNDFDDFCFRLVLTGLAFALFGMTVLIGGGSFYLLYRLFTKGY